MSALSIETASSSETMWVQVGAPPLAPIVTSAFSARRAPALSEGEHLLTGYWSAGFPGYRRTSGAFSSMRRACAGSRCVAPSRQGRRRMPAASRPPHPRRVQCLSSWSPPISKSNVASLLHTRSQVSAPYSRIVAVIDLRRYPSWLPATAGPIRRFTARFWQDSGGTLIPVQVRCLGGCICQNC